jgi:methylmalonyl-CoA mutase
MLNDLQISHKSSNPKSLKALQSSALHNRNIFAEMMEVAKTCSLGQMTSSLFEVGGQYRRNM